MIPQCSDKEFEDFNRPPFDSVCKNKGVRSIRTYRHKIQGKSTDSSNIEKYKTQLTNEPRGGVLRRQRLDQWVFNLTWPKEK